MTNIKHNNEICSIT